MTATAGTIAIMAGAKSFFPALSRFGVFAVAAASWLVFLVILAWLFSSIYRVADVRAPSRWGVSRGGVLAALGFLAGTFAFDVYMANFGKYNATYGALAGLIVLLLWLRLAALSILWGSGVDAKLAVPLTTGIHA